MHSKVPPDALRNLKFAIRETTAFVAHSFSGEDREIVEQIISFLTKLGVKCETGKRAEPKAISDKVNQRIDAAELFVGIFTRKQKSTGGKFSTSGWVIEEKATATAAGKKLLLFVEEGVEDFGGLQGDYEYIPFSRDNFGAALISAMDYVLAFTSISLQCRIDGDKVHFNFQLKQTPAERFAELKKLCARNPRNFDAHIEFARMTAQMGDKTGGLNELKQLVLKFPAVGRAHHELAHMLQSEGNLADAVLSFQKALDLSSNDEQNYRCYGRCLMQYAKTIADDVTRRSTLQKAKRLLERAKVIGGDKMHPQINGDLFLVDEALEEFGETELLPEVPARAKRPKKK